MQLIVPLYVLYACDITDTANGYLRWNVSAYFALNDKLRDGLNLIALHQQTVLVR